MGDGGGFAENGVVAAADAALDGDAAAVDPAAAFAPERPHPEGTDEADADKHDDDD